MKFCTYIFYGEQETALKNKKHTLKWAPKYLKMALIKGGGAVKRFHQWGKSLGNTNNIYKKIMYSVFKK